MPINTKTIKRRIKSVASTRKITKAMEMISAVKMRKAVANDLASRNYATLAWAMLSDIALGTEIIPHPLLAVRPLKKIGLILVTSNRGLAGGFNTRLLQAANDYIVKQKEESGVNTEVILLGKRGQRIYHQYGHKIVAAFDKVDLTTQVQEILPLVRLVLEDYLRLHYDQIMIAYTDFVSPLAQIPTIKQILPIAKTDVISDLQERILQSHYFMAMLRRDPEAARAEALKEFRSRFAFEPDPLEALDLLLPRLVEVQIYQAILESDASEHSARMMTMRNATEAASDMIDELTHTYNKARQAAITQEISEIVGGAAALA